MMKLFTIATLPALAAAHGNMLYPYAWWDANGTVRRLLLARFVGPCVWSFLQRERANLTPRRPPLLCQVGVYPGATCVPGCGEATGGPVVADCEAFCSEYRALAFSRFPSHVVEPLPPCTRVHSRGAG
jgi:hypothetical protein